MAALRDADLDVPVVVGGIVQSRDEARLAGLGVVRVVHPGTPLAAVAAAFRGAPADARPEPTSASRERESR